MSAEHVEFDGAAPEPEAGPQAKLVLQLGKAASAAEAQDYEEVIVRSVN